MLPRFFHRSYSSVAKSKLAILRKKTGFPLSKCKEALSQNSEELETAEKWLYSQAQAEGWAKVEKLKSRTANQGLIGLIIKDNRAAMVEVNCETDFVAKNEKFRGLVSCATNAVLKYQPPSMESMALSSTFKKDDLGPLKISLETSAKSLADVVAETVGNLAENLVLQRGCLFTAPEKNGVVCGHVYNTNSISEDGVAMGRYASLLHLSSHQEFNDIEAVRKLGVNIAQHIIGMNPLVINEGDEGVTDPSKVLTKQSFLLDDEMLVGNMLAKHDVQITQFIRYALGEET